MKLVPSGLWGSVSRKERGSSRRERWLLATEKGLKNASEMPCLVSKGFSKLDWIFRNSPHPVPPSSSSAGIGKNRRIFESCIVEMQFPACVCAHGVCEVGHVGSFM